MDFIVPLLEDLGMAFVEIGATFIDHLDQFDRMEIKTKELMIFTFTGAIISMYISFRSRRSIEKCITQALAYWQ